MIIIIIIIWFAGFMAGILVTSANSSGSGSLLE